MAASDPPDSPLTPELVAGYCEAIVTVTDPDRGDLLAVDAARYWGELWTVTAYNPYSVDQPDELNERRQAELETQVRSAGWTFLPATGTSPDGSWSEPGIALVGVSEADALALGRRWRQHALYHATPGELWVVDCSDGTRTRCGGHRT